MPPVSTTLELPGTLLTLLKLQPLTLTKGLAMPISAGSTTVTSAAVSAIRESLAMVIVYGTTSPWLMVAGLNW